MRPTSELNSIARLLTRPHSPARGSALDPLVEEVTWAAWRLASASPRRITGENSVQMTNAMFRQLVESLWLPGRGSIITEMAITFDDLGHRRLDVHLAIGILGESSTTLPEVAAAAAIIDRQLTASGLPYGVERVDPAAVLGLDPSDATHAALIRQRDVTIESDEFGDLNVLSRWNPTVVPWNAVGSALMTRTDVTRVRATVSPTEVTVTDRSQLDRLARRAHEMRKAAGEQPDLGFHVDRAVATLIDIAASFATPVMCTELAITSSGPLQHSFLRVIGAGFTSEADVVRGQGHTVVAAQRLLLGGVRIEPVDAEIIGAHQAGLPLRGGLAPRELRDLTTLFEMPIGWPIPIGDPIPTIDNGAVRRLRVPVALSSGVRVGRGDAGDDVCLPPSGLQRHMVVMGTTGTGKTTVLVAAAEDRLRRGQGFVFVDCHGAAADRLVAVADSLCQQIRILDVADSRTDRLALLPKLRTDGGNLVDIERAAGHLNDAVASSLADPTWMGPRGRQFGNGLLTMAAAQGAEIADAITWFGNSKDTHTALDHPGVPDHVRQVIEGVHRPDFQDAYGVRDWVSSKYAPLVSTLGRRILAPAGLGVTAAELVDTATPLIVNLGGVPAGDAGLIGHLIIAAFLDAALDRPLNTGPSFSVIVDEAHRFPVAAMDRAIAEGRKFGLSVALGTQSLGQLDQSLADAAGGAAVTVAFRQTPDSANRLAPVMGLTPLDLVDLPDLNAYIRMAGQPTCWAMIDPYPPCPSLRAKTPPSSAAVPIHHPRSQRPGATEHPIGGPTAADSSSSSFLDEWLFRRGSTQTAHDPR